MEKLVMETGTWLLHKDGGVYQLVRYNSNHTEREELLVNYDHIWPFNPSNWNRPKHLFDAAFTAITEERALEIMNSLSREDAQALVRANKLKRKKAAENMVQPEKV
jgi:hypothetical protein